MIGKCFYYDTPPIGQHLFVVLAPSVEQKGWFVCVNITTRRTGSDTTCELYNGDHPNLTEPVSVVVYGQARELPLPLIERCLREQSLPSMSTNVLLRIQQGALVKSSRMKKKLQDSIRKHLDGNPNSESER